MDAIDKSFHVSVAMRKLLGVDCPIAVIVLPTIVQSDPGEAHFLNGRKRVIHLLELHRPAVAPGTPDRAKSAVGRRSHLKSLPHHETAVFGERAKVVTLVHGDKCAKSMEALSRFQSSLLCGADGHPGVARIRHRNGERYRAWSRFHVTHRETSIFTPNIDYGSAATVVAGIHAEIIFLPESGTQRKNPIRTLLVGAALVGPECGSARR